MTAPRVARSPLLATLSASLALVGLSLAGTASAAGSAAPSTVDVARIVVSYGDLDLDTDRGAAALQRRLVVAARQVCGSPDPRDLGRYQKARVCTDAAMARAVDEVGSPRLAKLHAGRSRALRG
jgi:UrcA family protein